jgi:peptidyl-prolyl cis-trans isomerase B (cyclophilin B)
MPGTVVSLKTWASCAVLLGAVALASVGCGHKAKPAAAEDNGNPASGSENTGKTDGSGTSATTVAGHVPARFRQSFEEATRDDRPEECDQLPKQTLAGKSVGVLYEEVRMDWDNVKLVSRAGHVLVYPVTIETDLGDIDLELHPEWAPNHVRSFLALVRVGYYEGLTFDRRIEQESAREDIPNIRMVEAGCPLGLGIQQNGSIGYWLKSEFNEDVKHEEGTIGAWHGADPDTAACRFYICLSPAPTLDGRFTAFGKVTKGIGVAKAIFSRPYRISDDDEYGCHRFDAAPVIHKVVVHEPVEGVPAER